MKKRRLSLFLSVGMLAFYLGIVLYAFFAILHIQALDNFVGAILFELIGFGFLVYFAVVNLLANPIKTGFFVPLVMATVVYTVLLNIINFAFATVMPGAFFLLTHLILLFLYCAVSIPMYIMGKR